MVKIKDIHFCVKNLKMKRKRNKNSFDLPEQGFEPQIFMESEEPEIKSKQASKRDRTLIIFFSDQGNHGK